MLRYFKAPPKVYFGLHLGHGSPRVYEKLFKETTVSLRNKLYPRANRCFHFQRSNVTSSITKTFIWLVVLKNFFFVEVEPQFEA